jgi:hypothetical protein
MTAVEVFEVGAECGDFDVSAVFMHQNDAEVGADAVGTREKFQQLFGTCRGGDVEVFRCPAQEQVTNAPAHEIRGVAGGSESGHDRAGEKLRIYIDRHILMLAGDDVLT